MTTVTDLDDYQTEAMSTAVYPQHVGLMYVTLGLAGEAGEVANKVKKVYRDCDGELTEIMAEKIADELGDVLWYLAMAATEIGFDLSEIANRNVQKLHERQSRFRLMGDGDER